MEIEVGGATIRVEDTAQATREGRPVFEWTMVLPDGEEFSARDLRGGVASEPTEQQMIVSLLSFLFAAVEARQIRERSGVMSDMGDSSEWLFPAEVVTWADENLMELEVTSIELEGAL